MQGMDRNEQAFTLMEMLVVIAIIAILSTLALPSYQFRAVRMQIEEAMPLTEIAKAPVAASWALTKTFPADNVAAGLPVADKIVSNLVQSVTVTDGVINIRFGNNAHVKLQDKVITLRPAVVSDAPIVPVAWVCNTANVPDKMTVHGTNQTTVDDAYLPPSCRARKK